MRARCSPRQVCSPAANEMCGMRLRKMSNVSGCSQRASSRFAEPMHTSITAPSRYLDAVEFGGLGGEALHGGQRRLEPQPLLDGGADELAIVLHRRELLGMGQQQVEQVARRPVGGLQAGGQQQPQERVDGLVGQLLAVDLGGDEIADDVLGGLGLAQSICSMK